MEIPTEHDADDISRWIKTYGKQARIAAQRCQSAHGKSLISSLPPETIELMNRVR